jgi:hypothetical protein
MNIHRPTADFRRRFQNRNSQINKYGDLTVHVDLPADKLITSKQVYLDSPFVSSGRATLSAAESPVYKHMVSR